MGFGKCHLLFGCDIMRFFTISLFLLLLFDTPQGSSLSNGRSGGIDATLQISSNGNRNECASATDFYTASHEFRQPIKDDWSEYSRKCSAIISGFLQAIGNLVRLNHKQSGTLNFHINTTISQEGDANCHKSNEKCTSLPTIRIEAKDEAPAVNCPPQGHHPDNQRLPAVVYRKPTTLNPQEREFVYNNGYSTTPGYLREEICKGGETIPTPYVPLRERVSPFPPLLPSPEIARKPFPNANPRQPFGDNLGGQQHDPRLQSTIPFAPSDQIPTTILPPPGGLQIPPERPLRHPDQVSPPVSPKPSSPIVLGYNQETTQQYYSSPRPVEFPSYTETPFSSRGTPGFSQPRIPMHDPSSPPLPIHSPNLMETENINAAPLVTVPPFPQPQTPLMNTNVPDSDPQILPGTRTPPPERNQALIPRPHATARPEYDELLRRIPTGQPPQPGNNFFTDAPHNFGRQTPYLEERTPVSPEFARGEMPNFTSYNQRPPSTFAPVASPFGDNAPYRPSTLPPVQKPMQNQMAQGQVTVQDRRFQTTVGPQFQPSDERIVSQPPVFYDKQLPRVPVQSDSQSTNAPFDQFPTTLSPEQKPLENYETSQPTIVGRHDRERNKFQTTRPASRTSPTQMDTQFGGNAPFNQFPSTPSFVRQPVRSSEMAGDPSTLATIQDPEPETTTPCEPSVEYANMTTVPPDPDFYDEQPSDYATQPDPQFVTNAPFNQFLTTPLPEQQPMEGYLQSTDDLYEDFTTPKPIEAYVGPKPQHPQTDANHDGTEVSEFMNQQTPTGFVPPATPQLPPAKEPGYHPDVPFADRISPREPVTSSSLVHIPDTSVTISPTSLPHTEIGNRPPPMPNADQPFVSQREPEAPLRDHHQNIGYTTATPFHLFSPTSKDQFQPRQPQTLVDETASPEFSGQPYRTFPPVPAGNEGRTPPSSGFEPKSVSSYPGQVFNDKMTPPIPNTSAWNSETVTAPPISPPRLQSPADIYDSDSPPASDINDGDFQNRPFVTPRPAFDYPSTTMQPFFPNEQLPVTEPPVFGGNQHPTTGFPVMPVSPNVPVPSNQNSERNLGEPENDKRFTQTPDVDPSTVLMERQPTGSGQFLDGDKNFPSEMPNTGSVYNQQNTGLTTFSPTQGSQTPVPDYTSPEPAPFMPEVNPNFSQIPEEFEQRPNAMGPYTSRSTRFPPQRNLQHGREMPPWRNLETTLPPNFTPKDAAPRTPDPRFLHPTSPDPFELVNPSEFPQDPNPPFEFPAPLQPTIPPNPASFEPTPFTQPPPQFIPPNTRQPPSANQARPLGPFPGGQVTEGHPNVFTSPPPPLQHENLQPFTPPPTAVPQPEPFGNQPFEKGQRLQMTVTTTTTQQPPGVYPMNVQPSSGEVQPDSVYQSHSPSEVQTEQPPYIGTTEITSEPQENVFPNHHKQLTPIEYQPTVFPTTAPEELRGQNQMPNFNHGDSLPEGPVVHPSVGPQFTEEQLTTDTFITVQPIQDPKAYTSPPQTQPNSRLHSQSLVSTVGNDQPLPATFQPSYVPESQTETTLPYSNDPSADMKPSFDVSEQEPLDAPLNNMPPRTTNQAIKPNDFQAFTEPPTIPPLHTSGATPDYSTALVPTAPPTFQSRPNQQLITSVSPRLMNTHGQFSSTVSPNISPGTYNEDPATTTAYSSPPLRLTSLPPPNSFGDPSNHVPPTNAPREGFVTPVLPPNIPLNFPEQTPRPMTEATQPPAPRTSEPLFGETVPTPRPNLKSHNIQQEMPVYAPSLAPQPQPQPSLRYTTEFTDYKTEDGMGQTSGAFQNTSPSQLNPEVFGSPNAATTLQPELPTPYTTAPQRVNTNADFPLPGAQTAQTYAEPPSNENAGNAIIGELVTAPSEFKPTPATVYDRSSTFISQTTSETPDRDTEYRPISKPQRTPFPETQQLGEADPQDEYVRSPRQQTTAVGMYNPQTFTTSFPLPLSSPALNEQFPPKDVLFPTNQANFRPIERPVTNNRLLEQTTPAFYTAMTPEPTSVYPVPEPQSPLLSQRISDRGKESPGDQAPPKDQPQDYGITPSEAPFANTRGTPFMSYEQQTAFAGRPTAPPHPITPTAPQMPYPPTTDLPRNYYSTMRPNEPHQTEFPLNPQSNVNRPELYAYSGQNLNGGGPPQSDSLVTSPPTFQQTMTSDRPFHAQPPFRPDRGSTSDFPPDYRPTVQQRLFTTNTPMSPPPNFEQPLVTRPPPFALHSTPSPLDNLQEIRSEILPRNFPERITNTPVQAPAPYPERILNDGNSQFVPTPWGPTPASTYSPTESSPNSEQAPADFGNPPRDRLFEEKALPKYPEEGYEAPRRHPMPLNVFTERPERREVVENPTSPAGHPDVFTPPPMPRLTAYDETTANPKVLLERRPFDGPTTGRPVSPQPQTASPRGFEAAPTTLPMILPPMNEPSTPPPLRDALPPFATSPFPQPVLEPRNASPITAASMSFEPQNQMSVSPTYVPTGEFDRNFVTPQPLQPNINTAQYVATTPQPYPHALLPDTTTPPNKPTAATGLSCPGHPGDGSSPLMCPFDPSLKGNMTAPSYYILISKLPADNGEEKRYQVEKVYLGDGTPLSRPLKAGEAFPTALFTPIPFTSARTVKLRDKPDLA